MTGCKIGRDGMEPVFDFIDRSVADEKPFFVWYAPFLPHTPHNPPARLFEKYQAKGVPDRIAKYYAMCEWFDETCGELIEAHRRVRHRGKHARDLRHRQRLDPDRKRWLRTAIQTQSLRRRNANADHVPLAGRDSGSRPARTLFVDRYRPDDPGSGRRRRGHTTSPASISCLS